MTVSSTSKRGWYHPSSIWASIALRPRLYSAALASVLVAVLLPGSFSSSARHALAWVCGSVIYLASTGHTMWSCGPSAIAKNAEREDESRMVIMVLVLMAIGSSFVSIIGLLSEAKSAASAKWFYVTLAISTTIISWAVTQVVFTLHYAHEYYRPDTGKDRRGGLDFPGEKNPDYWDFLYFTTSIGAASQTSDVAVRSRGLRRLVTMHAVVSFFFNTAVVALMINLAAGLI